MKKYFGIVKNGYLWLCIAVTVAIASWILFFFNAEFSEEFTGGVSIEFNGEIKDDNFENNLVTALQEKNFPKLQVNVDQEEETVKLKIN
jgi:preprotein translocase subunit SecF